MPFQIHAIPVATYAALFDLDDKDLARKGARRVIATSKPGFPCRVSLEDADPGDELILVNHRHLDANTPYASAHAIYIRKDAAEAQPNPGEIPEVLASRLLSVRAFNSDSMMLDADVVEGVDLAEKLDAMFNEPNVDTIHIHNARQGCFAAKATRS